MATGIWMGNGDLAFVGYTGLLQEYIDRLAVEFRDYGFTTYKIGNYVIAETTDLVVVTEIFKRVVPAKMLENSHFKAIMGTPAELKQIEQEFREASNATIKCWE